MDCFLQISSCREYNNISNLNLGEKPMSRVYIVENEGMTSVMAQVKCRDEDKELQLLLERNHDLLPGDQINPEEPRRWLLVKREMPVPDPGTGEDRWSQ
jgi:hypothetical protein